MKKCLAFLLLIGSLAGASDLTVKITKRNQKGGSVATSTYDPNLSVDTGFTEQVVYVSGSNQRIEFYGIPGGLRLFMDQITSGRHYGSYRLSQPHMAVITHCDTGIVDELDLDSHQYREFKLPRYPDEKNFLKLVERAHGAVKRELLAETVETGETRDFFGYTARHLITTIRETRDAYHDRPPELPYSVSVGFIALVEEKIVTVVDGWYLDQPQPGCAPEFLRHNLGQAVTTRGTGDLPGVQPLKNNNDEPLLSRWQDYGAYSPGLQAEISDAFPYGVREVTRFETPPRGLRTRLVYTGYLPSGLAVEQEITTTGILPATRKFPEEKRIGTPLALEITELSDAALAPELFKVPAGFKKVKDLYRAENDYRGKAALR